MGNPINKKYLKSWLFIAIGLLATARVSIVEARSITGNNSIRTLRGHLAKINHQHRTITLEEEFTGLTRDFYLPFSRIDHLAVGDEVRVYFYPNRHEAFSVQKMTPVQYRKEDQNKGYLMRSEVNED